MTRGEKNNNFGNIRLTKINWKGKVKNELNTDKQFEQFISPIYGLRALYVLLNTYIKRGNNTISKIISVYAPTNENDTKKYINTVAKYTRIDKDTIIKISDLPILMKAISFVENGKNLENITDNIREAILLFKKKKIVQ